MKFRTLPLLLLLALPVVAQAQFNYTTNNGAITITAYTGPGGVVIIPDAIDGLPVTNIRDYAFVGNTSLTKLSIPASVVSIGEGAFYNCLSLSETTVDSLSSHYSAVGGVLFNKSKTMLIFYPPAKAGDKYAIPDSVTSVVDGAFAMCHLTGITVLTNVTSIGYAAFILCANLTTMTFPDSVTSVGSRAFYGCSSLISVTMPRVNSIADEMFSECSSLATMTIPNGATAIGVEAFRDCTRLANVVVPDSVVSVGDYAFAGCSNLRAVYFEGNAPRVGTGLFNEISVTVYYLPWTSGWGPTFAGRPSALWNDPQRSGFLWFPITEFSNQVVVVEASTNVDNPVWVSIGYNTLTNGSSYFSDPDWTNYPARFYRLRRP